MMEVVPFEASHLGSIQPRWPFTLDAAGNEELMERAASTAGAGPAWTAVVEDEPVACGGIVLLWPGVGEAWTFAGAGLDRSGLAFHRAVTAELETICRQHRLHRVQAACHANHKQGRRWLNLLGFREEGLMQFYGPHGHDFIRFARVRTPWPTR